MKFYIYGTGTFAEKLATTLVKKQLTVVSFIDEFRNKPLLSLPVCKASRLVCPDKEDIFFIAISILEYAENAKKRLIKQGIESTQIIILFYDSCAVLLEQMLTQNYHKTLNLISQCGGCFSKLESQFFPVDNTDKKQYSISFRMLSRGGNYYSHLANLPTELAVNNNISICSDEPIKQAPKTQMFSQQRMLDTRNDIVISPQLFICSPAETIKITLTHAIYDSVMFRDGIVETLGQPNNHYIAIPSKASFEQHKKICIESKLTNNVILIPIGYPKFDANLKEYLHISKDITPGAILYAPTQSATRKPDSNSGYSIDHAIKFLTLLSNNNPDVSIIFRPHPDDLKLVNSGIQSNNIKVLASLISFIENLPQGEIDRKSSPINSYCRAKLMISDTSSTAFTFAFSTLKPVVFYSPDEDYLPQSWLETCFFKDREKIGVIVKTPSELTHSVKKINNEFEAKSYRDRILALRKLQLFNVGYAESSLMDVISSIKKGMDIIGCWSLKEHQNSNK